MNIYIYTPIYEVTCIYVYIYITLTITELMLQLYTVYLYKLPTPLAQVTTSTPSRQPCSRKLAVVTLV